MYSEIEKIFQDRKDNFFASDDNAYKKIKCKLNPGKKILWYYQQDKKFADEHEFDIKDDPGYSGVILPFPGIELNAHSKTDLEPFDCIVSITSYPAEKEYCRSEWVSLERILDHADLVEIYSQDTVN